MAKRTCPLAIWAVLFIGALICAADASGGVGGGELLGWMSSAAAAGSACTGTIAECLAAGGDGGEEFELDSEVHRRILATNRYISYGALARNRVPCSHRGLSYYNCRPRARANPYKRGCSAITRCRR